MMLVVLAMVAMIIRIIKMIIKMIIRNSCGLMSAAGFLLRLVVQVTMMIMIVMIRKSDLIRLDISIMNHD